MSLQVYIAHTGQRLNADPVSFNSLDAFNQWISQSTSIPKQNLILLTTRGKHAKLQALLTEVRHVSRIRGEILNSTAERDIRL